MLERKFLSSGTIHLSLSPGKIACAAKRWGSALFAATAILNINGTPPAIAPITSITPQQPTKIIKSEMLKVEPPQLTSVNAVPPPVERHILMQPTDKKDAFGSDIYDLKLMEKKNLIDQMDGKLGEITDTLGVKPITPRQTIPGDFKVVDKVKIVSGFPGAKPAIIDNVPNYEDSGRPIPQGTWKISQPTTVTGDSRETLGNTW